jgi:hypothetical protein
MTFAENAALKEKAIEPYARSAIAVRGRTWECCTGCSVEPCPGEGMARRG